MTLPGPVLTSTADSGGTRSRPRRRRIWAVVALVTALILVSPVALRIWLKQDLQHESAPTTVYRRPITALQVNAPGSTIDVTAGRAGQVSVTSVLAWVFGKPDVTETWHGTTLAVGVKCPAPDAFGDCLASITLRVPASVAVQASAGAGSVAVIGLTGPVHAAVTSGNVELAYLSGPVWVSATTGSISGLSGLTAARLTAQVGSGLFALGFDAAPDSLALAVGSGSGRVTVPPGTSFRVTVPPGSGGQERAAVRLSPGISNPASARLITAELGSGALAVSYPGARSGSGS